MEVITLSQFVLADDDADDRSLFQEALNEVAPHSQLTTANNGADLIQLLSNSKADMVFLDLNMPLKNGIDCIKWIRELKQFRHLLVVAYSSAFDKAEINKAYAYGVHLYFIKPTKIGHLIEDLEKLFELNWDDPVTITSNHFINNNYVAFNSKRG
jgi:DNA-binding NarL/FixJ family response regulator